MFLILKAMGFEGELRSDLTLYRIGNYIKRILQATGKIAFDLIGTNALYH